MVNFNLVTRIEAARILGCAVSTLDCWIHNGLIDGPSAKIKPGLSYYTPHDIERFKRFIAKIGYQRGVVGRRKKRA